jgi:NAD(P)-dependent dehydrogenase (short-subunit alcohol dehydrogenase family)
MSVADPEEFSGRVALVTAAAGKGIGQAIARRLAAGCARVVVVTDIHAARTKQVTAQIAADYPPVPSVTCPGQPTSPKRWPSSRRTGPRSSPARC